MIKGKVNLDFDNTTYTFYDQVVKKTTAAKNGKGSVTAKLALPKTWAGKKVLCILLEEPGDYENITNE